MNPDKGREFVTIDADLITWLAVHGHLTLALRHPENVGPSAQIVSNFVEAIGTMLVMSGLLTQAELDLANNVERDHRGIPQ